VDPNRPYPTRRQTRWSWLAVVLMLLAASASLLPLLRGTMGYRPAYRERSTTGAPPPALVPRLVLIIVDGLRYDLSEQMPCLEALRGTGAWGKSIASFPSFSQPTWTALVTGARPEISGAALFNAAFESLQPIQVATLFEMAKEAGLTTALAGQQWWSKMVPAEHLDHAHFVAEFDAEGDAEAAEAAIELYARPDVDFLLLYLGEYDELNHSVGALSTEALKSIEHSDRAVCALVSAVDLTSTALVVTADHGQLDAAGHGGDDRTVRETPLIMAGARVRPGRYPAVQQPDIPATIAALLGVPFPRSGQGRVLYDWLDLTEEERARGEVALVAQQAAWADAYLASFQGSALPVEHIDSTGLEALLRAGDWPAAQSAAASVRSDILQYVEGQRSAEIARSRWLWLLPSLFGLGLLGVLLAATVRASGWAPICAVVAGGAAYHAFYLLRGHVYSLSTLSSMGSPLRFLLTLVVGALIALAVGIGLLWLASRRASSPVRPLSRSIPALYAALCGLFAAVALCAWLVNGSLGGWLLVSPKASFVAILSVAQLILVGLLGLVIMAGAAIGGKRARPVSPGERRTGSLGR